MKPRKLQMQIPKNTSCSIQSLPKTRSSGMIEYIESNSDNTIQKSNPEWRLQISLDDPWPPVDHLKSSMDPGCV